MNSINLFETKVGHKIALYLRTASEDQEDSQNSLEAQEKKLRNLIRSRNRREHFGKIVRCFSDSGCSGMDQNRLGLKALLEAVKQREMDIVLVSDIARLSRSMKHLIEVMTMIAVNQCRIETSMGHIPLGTAVDLFEGRRLK